MRGEQLLAARDMVAYFARIVIDHRPPQPIALPIGSEAGFEIAAILERLAEREVEVESILGRKLGCRDRPAHCLDFLVGKSKGLQIGEAPPDLPQSRV